MPSVLLLSRTDNQLVIHLEETLQYPNSMDILRHKEALAVVWAVKRLHKYLYGSRFTTITDHQALKYIFDPQAFVGKATSAILQRVS